MSKIITVLLLIISLILIATIAYGYDLPQEKVDIVKSAVSDYSKDYNVGKCYLNGAETSLTAIVLGITSSESSFGEAGLGAKHNNRGNLKLAQQYPLPKQKDKKSYVHGDGGKYYIYDSAYDGIYDIAHWVNTKGKTPCNVTTRTFTIFIKGTTNISATQQKAVERHVNNLTQVAQAYDSGKPIYVVNNKDTQDQADIINGDQSIKKGTPLKVKPTKECRMVAQIKKDEFIQIDSQWGAFKMRLKELRIGDKLFVCRDL